MSLLLLCARAASADDARSNEPVSPSTHDRAREAYDRGTTAHARGEFQKAAEEFARADALEPSAVALQAALDSAILADDPALGAELLARTARGPVEGALAETSRTARTRFARRTGRIRIGCGHVASCLATVDGIAIDTKTTPFFRVGPHTVIAQRDGQSREQIIDVRPDDIAFVTASPRLVTPSPAAQPTERPSASGLSPGWFIAGAAVTAVLGVASVMSGLDTSAKQSDFKSAGCAGSAHGDCTDAADAGSSAQVRTNVLLGVTAVAAIATAAVGVFFVNWGGERRAQIAVGTQDGIPHATLRAVF